MENMTTGDSRRTNCSTSYHNVRNAQVAPCVGTKYADADAEIAPRVLLTEVMHNWLILDTHPIWRVLRVTTYPCSTRHFQTSN
jgi:hypothetical protein